jgi:hypothetical protein
MSVSLKGWFCVVFDVNDPAAAGHVAAGVLPVCRRGFRYSSILVIVPGSILDPEQCSATGS